MTAIIIAIDQKRTQAQTADILRCRWNELWKLAPAERRVRIDEILRGELEPFPGSDTGAFAP